MQKSRRQFSAKEKFDAVRQVIARAKTVSGICEEMGIHPNVYYRWQTEFFEGALDRFESKKRGRKSTRRQRELEKAEEEIRRLNAVVAEVVKENVELKKKHGDL